LTLKDNFKLITKNIPHIVSLALLLVLLRFMIFHTSNPEELDIASQWFLNVDNVETLGDTVFESKLSLEAYSTFSTLGVYGLRAISSFIFLATLLILVMLDIKLQKTEISTINAIMIALLLAADFPTLYFGFSATPAIFKLAFILIFWSLCNNLKGYEIKKIGYILLIFFMIALLDTFLAFVLYLPAIFLLKQRIGSHRGLPIPALTTILVITYFVSGDSFDIIYHRLSETHISFKVVVRGFVDYFKYAILPFTMIYMTWQNSLSSNISSRFLIAFTIMSSVYGTLLFILDFSPYYAIMPLSAMIIFGAPVFRQYLFSKDVKYRLVASVLFIAMSISSVWKVAILFF